MSKDSESWACTEKNGRKGGTGEWGKNREMSKDTEEKKGNAEGRVEHTWRRQRNFVLCVGE